MIVVNRYYELINKLDDIYKINVENLGPYFNIYVSSINKHKNIVDINKKDISYLDEVINNKIKNNDIYLKLYIRYYGYLELLKNMSLLNFSIINKYIYLSEKNYIISKYLYKFLNLKFCPYKLLLMILKEYKIMHILYKIEDVYIIYLPYRYDKKLENKLKNIFYYFKPIEINIEIIWEYASAYISIKNLSELDNIMIRG